MLAGGECRGLWCCPSAGARRGVDPGAWGIWEGETMKSNRDGATNNPVVLHLEGVRGRVSRGRSWFCTAGDACRDANPGV